MEQVQIVLLVFYIKEGVWFEWNGKKVYFMDLCHVLCFSSCHRADNVSIKVSARSRYINRAIIMDGYICLRNNVP